MPPARVEDTSRPRTGPPGRFVEPTLTPECPGLPATGKTFLDSLIKVQIVDRSAIGLFLSRSPDQVKEFTSAENVGNALVQAGLLTPYQLDRAMAGTMHGMVLGNHRVLERLGAGSMGVVFLAEHMLLKRRVAIKVLPVDEHMPPAILERFYAEMRVLADMHHPNIVMAFDAGKLPPPSPNSPALHYLVMELVSGGDIEQYVIDHNCLPIAQACEMIRQAACGLQAAHDHHLIHRDIKPSNILLTQDGQVKLVDFGLARQFHSNLTDPSCLLGSVEFMAPEQSIDPSAVGGQADIYGLGATLFWMLTGQTPYPEEKSIARALRRLQLEKPRRLRELREDAPPELDVFIDRMLTRNPADRPAMPITVMNALSPFAAPAAPAWEIYNPDQQEDDTTPVATSVPKAASPDNPWWVLIVDDDAAVRQQIRSMLEPVGCICAEAADGETALNLARTEPFAVILLELNLKDISGFEVCSRLRVAPPRAHLKIVMLTDPHSEVDLAKVLGHGADDCLPKPLSERQVSARVQYMLRLKDAQDRTDMMVRHLRLANRQLADSIQAKSNDVRQAHDALLYALAKMVESRDGETAAHCKRLQMYCRALGDDLVQDPLWSGVLTGPFMEIMERCIPVHDIGKVALPEVILSKTSPLTPAERTLIQQHPLIGAEILESLARAYGESLSFLAPATNIVKHHHERYDGQGYPSKLFGDAIPAAARILAIADVYDALRRKRFHKPALTHDDAVRAIQEESDGQFDPAVLDAFSRCADRFREIYQQIRD